MIKLEKSIGIVSPSFYTSFHPNQKSIPLTVDFTFNAMGFVGSLFTHSWETVAFIEPRIVLNE